MGCGRFCLILFPLVFSLTSLVATLVCFGGSTSHALEHVYIAKLDLTGLSVSALINDTVKQEFPDIDSELNFPDFYTVSLWNYCEGQGKASTTPARSDKILNCSSPEPMYVFDPVSVLTDKAISTSEVLTIGTSIIDFPTKVQDYWSVYKGLTKALFVTIIIGFCLTALQCIMAFFAFNSKGMSFCASLWTFLSAAFLTFTFFGYLGIYLVVSNLFSDVKDTYGITCTINNYFFGLGFAATGLNIISFLLFLFSVCCGTVSQPAPRGPPKIEEVPLEERPMIAEMYQPNSRGYIPARFNGV